jgi:uncharacterized membrane protein/YHS domain-containing protein
MFLALRRPLHGRKALSPILVGLGMGLVTGSVVYAVSLRLGVVTSARASLYGAAILAALVNAATLPLSGKRARAFSLVGWGGALYFLAAMTAVTIFSFLGYVAEQAISATTVLNTELILNIGGILAGALLVSALVPLSLHLGAKNGRRVVIGVVLFSSLILVVPWSAEVLLGLMRLEMVELTSLRLSFVAKVTKYAYLGPYVQSLLITALAAVYYCRREVPRPEEWAGMQKSEQRKARSLVILEMRWFKAALTSVAFILAVSLYYDVYASRPPKITPPVEMTPDAAGLIRFRVVDVSDGRLHRYSYITDDGHVVRFFLINRSRGQGSRIGVVYDACMMCGDMGYLQEKNEVICIACNVRMFVPTIGKEGGCNPIPLAHKLEADQIVIAVADLDKGARYFSEVVSRKVKDPVTGKEVDSSKASYQYEYQGRTYFFESEQSAEKFKASPESYIGKLQSRYYRVQGYQKL